LKFWELLQDFGICIALDLSEQEMFKKRALMGKKDVKQPRKGDMQ